LNKKMNICIITLLLVTCFIAIGCVDDTDDDVVNATNEQNTGKSIIIGYPSWDDAKANTFVLKQILESEGYEVETIAADLGAIFQAIAQDDIDIYASAWLPATHKPYWDKYGEDIEYVNNISTDARSGLVVPTYVTIDSIDELQENRDKFEGKIYGIEPGAGIMQNTEKTIEEYDLDYELLSSSTVGMSTILQDSIDNEEWVVVTLWQPHWTFARMDLKFLEDPKGSFGGTDNITMLARTGFKEENPGAYEIISAYEMDINDISSIMIDLGEGMSPEDAAAKWIQNNPEKVDDMLGK